MDIRRLPLWEGRNATYMSNDILQVVVEDQGAVTLEISAECPSGGRVNALCLPYFRATGSGVLSDPNGEWYRMKQTLYQAGGSYFTFPFPSEDHVTSNGTYWTVRKYGTEDRYGGVWLYSEMKSREEGNRYRLEKIDLVIPGQPVVYTAVRITNPSEEPLVANPSLNVMLGPPFFESGCFFDTNARHFSAYPKTHREVADNRFQSGPVFEDLKHAPLAKGGNADASYVPAPTGTYDYLLGKIPGHVRGGRILCINPRLQMGFMVFTPRIDGDDSCFPNISLTQNYLGRLDAPWALWDGATSQVFSATLGLNWGPSRTRNFVLDAGSSKTIYYADSFFSYDNPRMSLGFYSFEAVDGGFLAKRTKSTFFIPCDHSFDIVRDVSSSLFQASTDAVRL